MTKKKKEFAQHASRFIYVHFQFMQEFLELTGLPFEKQVGMTKTIAMNSKGSRPQKKSMVLESLRIAFRKWNMGNCSFVKKGDVIEVEESLTPLQLSKSDKRSIFSSTSTLSTKYSMLSYKSNNEGMNFQSSSMTAIDSQPSSTDRDDDRFIPPRLPAPLPPTGDIYKLEIGAHEEFGSIKYHFSSLEGAKDQSRRSRRLIFVVEAELPGDKQTGLGVLSHPLIVEAVASTFITCEIRMESRKIRMSNRDRKLDYTKIRILDEEGMDVIPIISGEHLYLGGVADSIIKAMKVCSSSVPSYLSLLREESMSKQQVQNGILKTIDRKVTFGMEDSNIGEVELAGLEGVISTSAGYMNGESVVEVTYDSTRVCFCNVVQHALRMRVADTIYYRTNDERLASQIEVRRIGTYTQIVKHTCTKKPNLHSKKALRKTMMRFVPLTDYQAARANRLCHLGVFNEAMHLLSPKQGMIMMNAIRSPKGTFEDIVDVPIVSGWRTLSRKTLIKP